MRFPTTNDGWNEGTVGTPPTSGLPVSAARHTRVLIYDRSDVLRRALSEFVNSQPDLTTCGTADSPEQTIHIACQLHPDVVVLGFSFTEAREVELITDLLTADRRTQILVLSLNERHPGPATAAASGARGYVEKDEPPAAVLTAIRSVARGRPYGVEGDREM
jgi:DNA-binding NarL/FixJ family response regulator